MVIYQSFLSENIVFYWVCADRFTFVFFTSYIFICVLKIIKQQCCYNYIVKTKPIIKQFHRKFENAVLQHINNCNYDKI